MNKTNLKAVDTPSDEGTHQETRPEAFAHYVSLIITDKRTPRAVVNVLAGIIISDISNNSGYAWHVDEEGLRFMLPRLLSNMNEMYAEGLITAALTAAEELMPTKLRDELWHRRMAEIKKEGEN